MAHVKSIYGHGYWYESYRSGGTVKTRYLGPVSGILLKTPSPTSEISNKEFIHGDFDKDGTPNVDDKLPFRSEVSAQIGYDTRLSDELKKIEEHNRKHQTPAKNTRRLLEHALPKAEVTSRVKSTPSTVNKLNRKSLASIQDSAGVRVLTDSYAQLVDAKNQAIRRLEQQKGVKIVKVEDFYAHPKEGNEAYRAVHIDIQRDGVPVEIQLKTKRMQDIHDEIHTSYKTGSGGDADALKRQVEAALKADLG